MTDAESCVNDLTQMLLVGPAPADRGRVESVDAHEPMGIADAEAFAQRILATIDEHQASAVVDPARHDADRARVAADLLRRPVPHRRRLRVRP